MRRFFWALCTIVVVGGSLAVFVHYTRDIGELPVGGESVVKSAPAPSYNVSTTTPPSESTSVVRIGGTDVRVVLADTPAKRTRGLSGTNSLGENEGMLFIFPEEGLYGFWMKDMHYPIDIIWLDSAWSIVHLAESVSPESYPASFSPSKPARYVLEVPAGFAKSHNIAVGGEALFLR